ncbi:MAG: beta-ketoacyl-ACP synthase II [Candidatus Obscuribacterales bacterium]|nr:beta-ketoacyl-ACP synthase II [Candidatus Obscuribacterales bacterium]
MAQERVVVTGIGIVSSLGLGKDQFWQNLLAGKSGISKVTLFDEKLQSYCKIAGQIPEFNPLDFMDAKQAKRMDRFIQFAVAASKLAVKDAELDLSKDDPTRVGVCVGSAAGGFETIEKNFRALVEKGPDRCSPFTVPMLIVNMAAGWVSMLHNAKGPNTCAVTACATSAHSIGDAVRIIQRGEADVMFAGGSEAPVTALCMAGFAAARTLSSRNSEPERASRPWDKDRDGFVMAEGAAILMLESLSHAQARGAKILGEFAGYGMTGDAHDIVAPCADGDGAMRAMQLALKDAKMKPEDVNYINAHGTSTSLGDKAETMAIKRTFGDYAYKVPVSSTKSMTGHLLGATGSLEASVVILSILNSAIPPTINLENPDESCDLDYVPLKARLNVPIKVAMSNSFGFGGHNASLIFKKYEP